MNEQKAISFCEKYGIIDYKVQDNTLVYYRNSAVAQGVYRTYKHTVNLETMKENVQELKRLNKKGFINK